MRSGYQPIRTVSTGVGPVRSQSIVPAIAAARGSGSSRTSYLCCRHRPVAEQHTVLTRRPRGHYAYFGGTTNYPAIARLYTNPPCLITWLSSRSQGGVYPRRGAKRLLARFPSPRPRIVHGPQRRVAKLWLEEPDAAVPHVRLYGAQNSEGSGDATHRQNMQPTGTRVRSPMATVAYSRRRQSRLTVARGSSGSTTNVWRPECDLCPGPWIRVHDWDHYRRWCRRSRWKWRRCV